MEITVYHSTFYNEVHERFQERMQDADLKYLASGLYEYGLQSPEEIEKAVERATQICRALNISVKRNFRKIYIAQEGAMYRDWRLSELGQKLTLLNGDPGNPVVAKLQLELLKRFK